MTPPDVAALLRQHRFSFSSEEELQRGVAAVLDGAVGYEREARLGPRDRLDFLTHDGVGIECKCKGSLSALLRQVYRYTESERVTSVVIVTNLSRLTRVPATIAGKSVTVVHLTCF